MQAVRPAATASIVAVITAVRIVRVLWGLGSGVGDDATGRHQTIGNRYFSPAGTPYQRVKVDS
ncbi:hypothetical protein GCM10028799_59960 [Kribbella italica]